MVRGIGDLHSMVDFHQVADIGVRFNHYGREEELEPGYIMVWEVNYIMLIGGPESILKCVSGIHNTNGEALSGIDCDNQMECRRC